VTVGVAYDGCAGEVGVCMEGELSGRERIEVVFNGIIVEGGEGEDHDRGSCRGRMEVVTGMKPLLTAVRAAEPAGLVVMVSWIRR
jgi:hypothetical protein